MEPSSQDWRGQLMPCTLSCPLPCANTAVLQRTQEEVPFWKWKAALTDTESAGTLGLYFSASRNIRNKFMFCTNDPFSRVLFQQHKWTKKMSKFLLVSTVHSFLLMDSIHYIDKSLLAYQTFKSLNFPNFLCSTCTLSLKESLLHSQR